MRFILSVVVLTVLSASALAKGGEAMSLARAQAAAAKGDQKAAFALQTMTNRESCISECANRGHGKNQCASACRPGLCHPGAEQPYCVSN